ncbi:guanine deaminase [Sneathiella chinensis]|uniref:Guanine deaminase n=1 Tax=Sneathiella chinensis TaxID=349750 RepID=A0ABQ5TZU8_9PROT|nr:guanine deaminase [Sneathiella chinensis]GLQ05400.1 guanine deaminase [Sneathiella chinensis]
MKTAIRGSIVSFRDDPFLVGEEDFLYYEQDGLVVMEAGKITAVGPADRLLPTLGDDVPVTRYGDGLILPGFIDCHVHYPQTQIIGAYGKQLIDWLNKYTFVAEQNFSDRDHASLAAHLFLKEALASGTTTASVFCTVDPVSVDAFFEQSVRAGMRNIAGKVLMDRHAPAALLDTAQTGYDQTKALIEKWHGKGRSLYSVTPRFAPTSTPEQMEMTGAVWKEHPGTYLQSHISENLKEIEWVKELYPDQQGYLDVYEAFGQLGPRAIYGHGVHLKERECQRLHETGTALAHCPTSNMFLGSGLFRVRNAAKAARPVRVGLATDLGAGTSFSMLRTMGEAYKVAQLGGASLNAFEAFYLATRGAAKALYLEDTIGSIAPGMEADMVVLDLKATELLRYRLQGVNSLEEQLFVLMTLADSEIVRATYVAGEVAASRNSESGRVSFSKL